MDDVVFNTNAKGVWTEQARAIRIVDMTALRIYEGGGELKVWLNPEDWDFDEGLVYGDPQFLDELRAWLTKQGLPGEEAYYTEHGMQGQDEDGENFVSLEVGLKFLYYWKKKERREPTWKSKFFPPNNY